MEALVLPGTVFMLGTKYSAQRFTPKGGRLADGALFVPIWTSRAGVEERLVGCENKGYFEMDSDLAIVGLLDTPVRYVLVDAPPRFLDSSHELSLDSLSSNTLMDLDCQSAVLDAFCNGIAKLQSGAGVALAKLREFAPAHPEMRPRRAFDLMNAQLQHDLLLLNAPASVLLEKGLFDEAAAKQEALMKGDTFDPFMKSLFRTVWQEKLEMCASEIAMYFATVMTTTKLGELRGSADYEVMCRAAGAVWRHCGWQEEAIHNAREMLNEYQPASAPLLEALMAARLRSGEKLVSTVRVEDVEEPLRTAFTKCPPPANCHRCGEPEWSFVSLSPTAKSATYECAYCKTRVLVKEELDCGNALAGREPIPKKVQRAVWRRDGGRCVLCGSQCLLEFDHIIPISRGGANTERNIQLLCQTCNRSKSDRSPGS